MGRVASRPVPRIPITTAMYRLIQGLGETVEANYALVDLGPNVGALNRSIMIGSDGFVVPLSPDLFSLQALPSVGKSTSRWIADWAAARSAASRAGLEFETELPRGDPRPLGYINQQFATYRKVPAAAFRRWIDQISDRLYGWDCAAPGQSGCRDPGIWTPSW